MQVKVDFRPNSKCVDFTFLLTKRFGTFAYSALMIISTSKRNAKGFRISTVQTANKEKEMNQHFLFPYSIFKSIEFCKPMQNSVCI